MYFTSTEKNLLLEMCNKQLENNPKNKLLINLITKLKNLDKTVPLVSEKDLFKSKKFLKVLADEGIIKNINNITEEDKENVIIFLYLTVYITAEIKKLKDDLQKSKSKNFKNNIIPFLDSIEKAFLN